MADTVPRHGKSNAECTQYFLMTHIYTYGLKYEEFPLTQRVIEERCYKWIRLRGFLGYLSLQHLLLFY